MMFKSSSRFKIQSTRHLKQQDEEKVDIPSFELERVNEYSVVQIKVMAAWWFGATIWKAKPTVVKRCMNLDKDYGVGNNIEFSILGDLLNVLINKYLLSNIGQSLLDSVVETQVNWMWIVRYGHNRDPSSGDIHCFSVGIRNCSWRRWYLNWTW